VAEKIAAGTAADEYSAERSGARASADKVE